MKIHLKVTQKLTEKVLFEVLVAYLIVVLLPNLLILKFGRLEIMRLIIVLCMSPLLRADPWLTDASFTSSECNLMIQVVN